ncbi:prepilin-type N-terminal cleavage/methylation domain-containing protein [Marinobacter sp. F4218]|uniref:prepilin-type N-terminal cleavage/methylation domain-containing protein n=1 Tax=Marinobacter sp. F4218 TaxID=2862868 RepID=UPI001C629448|nr:prepilin-type N-terminal cleavage/methylation domain-containing protein [Marinobacter sp. F4218]MBW7473001.1 prepilin-type N-terminal cleavage/methylation domain-containing protein [Marinobacter sp. F4218]
MRREIRGATLVELVITIVIISIAIAGVVGAFALISGRSADPLNETRAIALAQLYVDEILAKKYDEQTPQGGVPRYAGVCNVGADGTETRASFDDVDDYDGVSDTPPASALGGITGYSGFSVEVSITCAGGEVGLPASQAKRIDVLVSAPDNRRFVFSAYRANF